MLGWKQLEHGKTINRIILDKITIFRYKNQCKQEIDNLADMKSSDLFEAPTWKGCTTETWNTEWMPLTAHPPLSSTSWSWGRWCWRPGGRWSRPGWPGSPCRPGATPAPSPDSWSPSEPDRRMSGGAHRKCTWKNGKHWISFLTLLILTQVHIVAFVIILSMTLTLDSQAFPPEARWSQTTGDWDKSFPMTTGLRPDDKWMCELEKIRDGFLCYKPAHCHREQRPRDQRPCHKCPENVDIHCKNILIESGQIFVNLEYC